VFQAIAHAFCRMLSIGLLCWTIPLALYWIWLHWPVPTKRVYLLHWVGNWWNSYQSGAMFHLIPPMVTLYTYHDTLFHSGIMIVQEWHWYRYPYISNLPICPITTCILMW
jgi:hypothetical protein